MRNFKCGGGTSRVSFNLCLESKKLRFLNFQKEIKKTHKKCLKQEKL